MREESKNDERGAQLFSPSALRNMHDSTTWMVIWDGMGCIHASYWINVQNSDAGNGIYKVLRIARADHAVCIILFNLSRMPVAFLRALEVPFSASRDSVPLEFSSSLISLSFVLS